MRKLALLSTSLLAGAVTTAPAHAVDVELYGQVNKAVAAYDDGVGTDFAVVDNDKSSTRLGVKGKQMLDNGMTASVLMEFESQSNPSNTFTQASANGSTGTATTSAPATATFTQRHAAVGLAGNWGGVTVGQTKTATDGVFTKDMAGVGDLMNADIFKFGGGVQFRTAAGALSGNTTRGMTSNVGVNRQDLVRYDTPKVNGFSGKASIAQGGDVDMSALYQGKFDGFNLAATAGVKFNNDNTTGTNTTDTRYAAAVTAAMDNGFAGTLGYTTDEIGNKTAGAEDPDQWYAKVSYAWDAYEVAADYGVADHYGAVTTAKSEVASYGLGAQYNLGNGVSLSGMYRNFDADVTGSDLQDIDLFVANMRVKF